MFNSSNTTLLSPIYEFDCEIPFDEIEGAKHLYNAICDSVVHSSLLKVPPTMFEDQLQIILKNLNIQSKSIFSQRIKKLEIDLAIFELYDIVFQRAVDISAYCKSSFYSI